MSDFDSPDATAAARMRDLVAADLDRVRAELAELVAIPSVHDDPEHPGAPADAAAAVTRLFAEAGVELTAHETADGSIALVGERPGAAGAPTVLLYSHYDVQPAGDAAAWGSDPWTLTERGGRWYGRGTADCKGNIVMHLAALRALAAAGADAPTLRVVVEGSEERGGAGLADLLARRPGLFAAEVILIADCGNVEVGRPTLLTTLRGSADVDVDVATLDSPVHSGSFGGAAPDALAALIRLLDSLRDEHGRTRIDDLPAGGTWAGQPWPEADFRADAGVLDGVGLLADDAAGAAVADLVWARPAVTVTGIDCPPATGAVNAVPARAAARVNLRVPAGMDPAAAQDALVAHLERRAPAHARVRIRRDEPARPFAADVTAPAVRLLSDCLAAAYGRATGHSGQGGSIPLCADLLAANPGAELALFGVEEPSCRIHSADESVHPAEIRDIAVAEALFLAALAR